MSFFEKIFLTTDSRHIILKYLLFTIAVFLSCLLIWRLFMPEYSITANETSRQSIESAMYNGVEKIIAEGMAYGTLINITRDTIGNITEIRTNRGLLNLLSSRLNEEIKNNISHIIKNNIIINVYSNFNSLVSNGVEGTTHRLILDVKSVVGKIEVSISMPLTETIYIRKPDGTT